FCIDKQPLWQSASHSRQPTQQALFRKTLFRSLINSGFCFGRFISYLTSRLLPLSITSKVYCSFLNRIRCGFSSFNSTPIVLIHSRQGVLASFTLIMPYSFSEDSE